MNQFDPEASGSPRGEPEVSGYPGSARPSTAGDLAALLKLSGRGDEAAFAKLYDATAARAYGLAVRVVRDPSQAEEVAQEAFLEIWRTASRFDDSRGSAVSWILTLVHRKAVDRVRVGRGGQSTRHGVPPGQPGRRARLNRRGGTSLDGSKKGPAGNGLTDRGPA